MKALITIAGICTVIAGIATAQEWMIAVGSVLCVAPLAGKL